MKWLLLTAALLACGMIGAAVLAGSTLRARDEAVRHGLLSRAAHDVEAQLREAGPEAADEVLRTFVRDAGSVGAIELLADGRVLARAGHTRSGEPVDTPLFLGPSWRALAGAMPMDRRRPPFTARIWTAPGAGDSSAVAALTMWGSVAGAFALLLFAAGAARGITARQRAASLDEERRRLATVSAAGAGLAHRIRNPLATIKATAQVLSSQSEGAAQERAHRIVEASIRIETLVDDLLRFARPVEVRPAELDLAEMARAAGASVGTGGTVLVRADREHVISAIEELIANARVFDESGPEVVVSRRGRNGVVEVRDRGPGLQIDAELAFEPYVTTRASGTGLGLAAVRGLIRANGGDVTLANRECGGCVATIFVPAVTA